MVKEFTIENIWKDVGFEPTDDQVKAIKHFDGPLYITAGPGSGKTRVILWRAVNLIVFHNIQPNEILLTTFTEKAAHQLKDGLQSYLGMASNYTGKQYDIASMYIGTVHSICQKLLSDRRFSKNRDRRNPVKLMDQLEQYFFLKRGKIWNRLLAAGEIDEIEINAFFQKKKPEYPNKYRAITDCQSLFNRFSEERLNVGEVIKTVEESDTLFALILMYEEYLKCLQDATGNELCDLSLIQEKALSIVEEYPEAQTIFKHVIVDEYQDTNFIQEQLYFKLSGNKRICVVGDDDQALYRFRGSTVENFVDFPERVRSYLNCSTTKIALSTNYRSRKQIVDFYTSFIEAEDWKKSSDPNDQFRVHDKNIIANSTDSGTSVITTGKKEDDWMEQTAMLCKKLIDDKVVNDPNQIAFLFPSIQGNTRASGMISALKEKGLNVYAPRAGVFLEVPEATEIFGLFAQIFDYTIQGQFNGYEYNNFKTWFTRATTKAKTIINDDDDLKSFVNAKKSEIHKVVQDYNALIKVVKKELWDLNQQYDADLMRRKLSTATGLSSSAQKALLSPYLARIVNERLKENKNPFKLSQILNRITSLDWSLLDLFYQINGFNHFKEYYKQAQEDGNEASICNLSIISGYISKFMEMYSPMLSSNFLDQDNFSRLFFSSYLYTLHRMGESEHEDEDNPFPKGNIPFLTIHQSKGLEFPVVFVYPSKQERDAGVVEKTIRQLKPIQGEPLDKIQLFDIMRMFYVGLSRAEQLLIIPQIKGRGISMPDAFEKIFEEKVIQKISEFDPSSLPEIKHVKASAISRPYSYTADYLAYERCPRQYMIFRKYDFIPSRSQTMFFGSLVHNTIEDLHEKLKSIREAS